VSDRPAHGSDIHIIGGYPTMTSLSAEKPHDMIIGRAKRGQISRTDSEFFNGIGQQLPVTRSGRLSWLQSVA